jgi:hypothetical protein
VVEHSLGKGEVDSSILSGSTMGPGTPLPVHDTEVHTSSHSLDASSHSRGAFASELLTFDHPLGRRGRRECRVKASPMARLQKEKQAAVTTGSARSSGIPCAMGYGLYALSLGTGLIAPTT